ncbi:MAG: hypothetical protein PVH12_07065 [Candidatus Bathyarchaeota archaeon]|jgi:hypothetical protein
MNGRKKIKMFILVLSIFPFAVLFSHLGYLILGFFIAPLSLGVLLLPNLADSGFRALMVGCAVGLSLGTLIGYRIGIDERR